MEEKKLITEASGLSSSVASRRFVSPGSGRLFFDSKLLSGTASCVGLVISAFFFSVLFLCYIDTGLWIGNAMNPVPAAMPKAAARLLRAPRQCSNPGPTTTTQVRGYTVSGAGRRLREGGPGQKKQHPAYMPSRVGVDTGSIRCALVECALEG